jgi:hypothetical protein
VDLENKLKGLPPIYYINLDHRTDRREYMESQFDHWGIKDYHRVSASKYHVLKYEEWKDLIVENEIIETESLMSCAVNHIATMIDWYNTSTSNVCIIMEDDAKLENILYWNFDWEYFEKNLPENWDCIQLYFCRDDYIPMFLHRRIISSTSAACYMINRAHAKKIKDLLWIDGRYRITFKDNSYSKKYCPTVADGNIFDLGVSYSVPLLSLNTNFEGDNLFNNYKTNPIDIESTKLIDDWWKNEHHKFTLEEFFTYGKPTDYQMIRKVNYKKETKKNIFYS